MKKILSLIIATTLFVSCASEEAPTPCNELRVNVGVNDGTESITKGFVGSTGTTATGYTNLNSSGGTIGLFVTGTGYTATRTTATWSASAWTVNAPAIYLSGNVATVYAYYPSLLSPDTSTKEAPLTSTSIPSNNAQLVTADAVQTDFLYQPNSSRPTVTNASAGAAIATIALNHAMVKLSFVVNLGQNYPVTTLPTCSVVSLASGTTGTKKNLYTTTGMTTPVATMNIATGVFSNLVTTSTFSFAGITQAVNAYNAAPSAIKTFSVLVAPIAGPFVLGDLDINMTIEGKAFNADLPALAGGWVAGNEYTYVITVNPTAMTVGPTVAVTDWSAQTGGTVTYQ